MKWNIVDEGELKALGRKGAAALAIFKVVTILVLAYCVQSIAKGVDPGSFALAYLAFAGSVLAIFTGGNAVEHMAKQPKKGEGNG